MNRTRLLETQKRFLKKYPGGFNDPEFEDMEKKFKMRQHAEFAHEKFAADCFNRPKEIVDALSALTSKSAMVSMFEKPKMKEAVSSLKPAVRRKWANAIFELLHGDMQSGFEDFVVELDKHKLAKWTLVTLLPSYYDLQKEVFIKPSTTKLVIDKLELDLKYQSKPTWEFYREYRKASLQMRKIAKSVKAPSNPAFSGFLMMSLA